MVRRFSLAAAGAVCAVSVLVSGCGGTSGTSSDAAQSGSASTPSGSSTGSVPKAVLDAYVAKAKQGMKAAFGGSFKKIYSSIDIQPVYPDGIKYVYVFKNTVDPTLGAKYIDHTAPVLKTTFRTQVAPEMRKLGIAHPTVTWRYVNPDGSLVWTRTFS
jgi:hypothetical protein